MIDRHCCAKGSIRAAMLATAVALLWSAVPAYAAPKPAAKPTPAAKAASTAKSTPAPKKPTGPVIIANVKLGVTSLTKKDLQGIFLGKVTKVTATNKKSVKVRPVTLKSGKTHDAFLKSHVSKTATQFRIYWKKLVFTGKSKAPKAYTSDKSVVAYVAKTPGAIGYISASTAADAKIMLNPKTKKPLVAKITVKKK